MHQRAPWMIGNVFLLLFAAMSLLLSSGCSSGPPQDLHGPAPEVGQVYRSKSKVTMTNGKITITAGGRSQDGQAEMTCEDADEEEILAVVGGEVTRNRTRVITEQSTQRISADGQTEAHTDRSPLEGEMVECEKVGEEWKKTLVGKIANEKQALELKMFSPPKSTADCYPAEPVKPGHSWKVPILKLGKLFSSRVEIESGHCKMKFEKLIEVDGEPCAQIAEELEVRGKMRDEHGEWLQLELKTTGTIQRSLQRGFTLASTSKGTMTLSGTVKEGGQSVQVKISGPMTWETKRRQK
jgi:hypothetical protein